MTKVNTYPYIFSLSTVGIRHHFNQDYYFHSLRTDFTGDNGVGKSIIGDLLQLILAARRDVWKSGTEGMDKDKRKIETMPLPGRDLQFAYAFLNIEVDHDKFVTIGVCISSRSSINVKPFIIQRGSEFSATSSLLSFGKPIMAKDFMNGNTFLDLDLLKEKMFDEKDLYLQEFSKGDKIKDYHKLLYQNNILPVDLSIDTNLTMFTNVLQSFSRAKSLEINKSASLKNFIFPAQQDTFKIFEENKNKLSAYIKEYHELEKQRKGIEDKQKNLTHLRELERKKIQARADFLEAQVALSFQQKRRAEQDVARCEGDLEKVRADIQALTATTEQLEMDLKKVRSDREKNMADRDTLAKIINHEERENFHKDSIDSAIKNADAIAKKIAEGNVKLENLNETLKVLERDLPNYQSETDHFEAEKERQRSFLEPLELLFKAVERFSSIESLKKVIADRENHEHEKLLLQQLQSIPNFAAFESSDFVQFGSEATVTYETRLRVLDQQIPQLEGLSVLYDRNNKASLFSWAEEQKKPLSLAQETVLMHLKDILVEEAPEIADAQYTLFPDALFEGIRETKSGVWLALGPVLRFVPFVTKQMFHDPAQLGAMLEKGKLEIEREIKNLIVEKEKIEQLRQSLQKIGFHEGHHRSYQRRSTIEAWTEPEGLPTKLQWETWLPLASELENIVGYRLTYENTIDRWKTHHTLLVEANLKIVSYSTEIKLLEDQLQEDGEEMEELKRSISNSKRELASVEASVIALKFKLTIELEADAVKEEIQKQLEDTSTILTKQIADGEEAIRKNGIELSAHSKKQGGLESELTNLTDRLRLWVGNFDKHLNQFKEELDYEFISEKVQYKVDQEVVNVRLNTSTNTLAEYEANFSHVVNTYEEANKSERVKFDVYDFKSLEEVLLGSKIKHLDNIGTELLGLNEELRRIAEGHWTMVIDVFKYVEKKYKDCEYTITRLNHFFRDTLISKNYFIELDFTPSDRLKIDWIEKMRKTAQDQKFATGLFEGIAESPEAIIQNLAAKFCNTKNVEIKQLLDEKQYFDLKLNLKDTGSQQQFGGSHGQSYMAISLLCIGRLSIVEGKGKDSRSGIRFLIVEELANLDENNFSLFPRLAKEFGYQMVTMTPQPFAGFTEEGAFVHMLSPGKSGTFINNPPYSILRQIGAHAEIEKYLTEKNGLESA